MALHEVELFVVLSRSVRFLYKLKVYIFRYSLPITFLSYAPSIGANIVSGDRKFRICANFH